MEPAWPWQTIGHISFRNATEQVIPSKRESSAMLQNACSELISEGAL